jgi:3-hydroxyacyl-CoA dehydrogenase
MEMAVKGVHLAGRATAHDVVVSMALAEMLSGGDTDITVPLSEDDLLGLEREVFMTLIRHSDTLDRMEHMLETGKPLRN